MLSPSLPSGAPVSEIVTTIREAWGAVCFVQPATIAYGMPALVLYAARSVSTPAAGTGIKELPPFALPRSQCKSVQLSRWIPRQKTETTVQGISASNGIAYGEIFLYLQTDLEVPIYQVDASKRIEEIARFDQGLVTTRQQITKIKNEVEQNLGPDEARIFDAHLMVLEDQALIGETIREFEATGVNIETCFNNVSSGTSKRLTD